MVEAVMEACLHPEPNWWALVPIGCGIFILGMTVGALIGIAMAHEADRVRIIYPEAEG